MFKHSTFTVESLHRVVAMLVATAVVVWSVGVFNNAQAANLAVISNTLSDSDVSALSNHTVQFTIPTSSPGVIAGGTIVVTFPAGFNVATSGVVFTDVDISVNGTDLTVVNGAPGATASYGFATSGQSITLTSGSAAATITAGQTVRLEFGTNATFGTAGVNRVTNPSIVNSYEFIVTAGAADSGRTRVAIIDNVDVTAVVNTSFTFTVAGLATSTAVNGTSTTGSTTQIGRAHV